MQTWNQPRKRRLDSCSIDDISFVKHEYGKQKRPSQSIVYDPRPPSLRPTSDENVQSLRHELIRTGRNIALLHVLPCSEPVPESSLPSLPPPPPAVREKLVKTLQTKPQPVHLYDISTVCSKFLQSLRYTDEQRTNIEIATRQQSQSRRWFEERQFRITASKFSTVIKRKRQHTSLVNQLLYTTVSSSISSLQWGRQHEHDALQQYRQTLDGEHTLSNAGLFVDKCGYLGASPDGVVVDGSGRRVKIVEVKCPFNAKDKTIEEACKDNKAFCCGIVNGKPDLKDDHDYYYQIQGQMAITGVHECDFVVWTPKDLFVQTVKFDPDFWTDTCLPKLEHFFLFFLLPEIVFPKKPSPHDYSSHKSSMYL